MHPPGPAATPEREPRRQSWKIFLSKFNSGWNSVTVRGNSLCCACERWRRNWARVSAFFGANGAPTSSWRARETCPLSTRLWAACPRRIISSSLVHCVLCLTPGMKATAASNNSTHLPPSKSSIRFANSSRPTEPALLGLHKIIIGTKQNNFHARTSALTSPANFALHLSRSANPQHWRNLPLRKTTSTWAPVEANTLREVD